MRLNNLRVATKLWLAVGGIVASLALLIGSVSIQLANLQAQADTTLGAINTRVKAASTWAGLTDANAARTLALITAYDPAVETKLAADIAATSTKISAVEKTIEGMALG